MQVLTNEKEREDVGDARSRLAFTHNFRNNGLNDDSNGSDDEHDGSFEIRRDELDAIQGIYPDGVVIHEPVEEEKLGEYSVTLKPSTSNDQQTYCSIELKVKYKPRYPQRSPVFKLVELHGLTPKEVAKIKEIIKRIKTKNQEDAQGWVYYVSHFY